MSISGKTKVVAFLGSPCDHTQSPKMHNEAFKENGLDCVYVAFDVDKTGIKTATEALRTMGFLGANVSMPCKNAVIEHLDEVDPAALLCGSVNTIVNMDGKLKGYSTDGVGYMMSMQENDIKVVGEKMTIIGFGGAGHAIAVQAALDGAREISVFNRKGRLWKEYAEMVERLNKDTDCKVTLHELNNEDPRCLEDLRTQIAESSLLANATSVGMGEFEGQTCIPDKSFFHDGLSVSDVIYSPAETKLLEMAREAGCKTVNGSGMLFYQGAAAFRIWTGIDMPIKHMKEFLQL